MARRYKRYQTHTNSLDELWFLVVIAIIALGWQAWQSDHATLIYIGIAAALFLIVIVGLMIRRYQQAKRKLRALDIAAIDTMDPLEFERYIATLLKHRGFSDVRLTEHYDYGVDIVAQKDGLTWGIQVKRYSNLVKAEAVRQVVTALIRYKCDRSMVVTNNVFSRPAKALAEDNKCVLIDRNILAEWILEFQNSR